MKKHTHFILSALFLLSFASCSEDEMNNEEDSGNYNTVRKSVLTKEEMLRRGWKIVNEFKLSPSTLKEDNKVSKNEEIPFTANHLTNLGYNIDNPTERQNLKNAFAYYGTIPDGLIFNSNLSIDGNTQNQVPNSSNVSIIVGTPSVTVKTNGLDLPDDSYTTEVFNNGNHNSEITVTYQYKSGYRTTWQRTVSGSFELGAKATVGIPLIGNTEVSTKITVGGQTANGSDNSEEIVQTSTYKTFVPAHSKKSIAVVTKLKGSSVDYFIPITLNGRFKANFPSPVNGHYFWGFPIENFSTFLSSVKGESGVAKSVSNISVTIIESPAEPL